MGGLALGHGFHECAGGRKRGATTEIHSTVWIAFPLLLAMVLLQGRYAWCSSDTLPTPSAVPALEPFRPANAMKLSPCGAKIDETIKHSPAFGTLHVKLGPGAQIHAEAGAMVCMQNCGSETVLAGVDAVGHGSCLPSLSRAFF